MYEVIFLWVLALIYIIAAVVQDMKTREIANWISFSLIAFSLGFRFFYSLFNETNFSFFYNGLIGLAIFFVAGNVLYYGKVFAGGDAKLMIAMGTILPIYPQILPNLKSFFDFMVIFLLAGFFYVLFSSTFLCIKNVQAFKKKFLEQIRKNRKMMLLMILFSIICMALGLIEMLFFILGVLIFISSYLYLYSKAVDESCMIKKIKTKNLREGDWLYADLKIGDIKLKAKWEGVSKGEIEQIRKKYREVKIRQGIAFSPVFLIAFIIFAVLNWMNIRLWNPFW